MSATHEIRTIEDFRAITSQPVGIVVVYDTPTSVTRAHTTTCPHVQESYFTTKVIEGAGKNGSYFFYIRFEDAREETRAEPCATCRPSST